MLLSTYSTHSTLPSRRKRLSFWLIHSQRRLLWGVRTLLWARTSPSASLAPVNIIWSFPLLLLLLSYLLKLLRRSQVEIVYNIRDVSHSRSSGFSIGILAMLLCWYLCFDGWILTCHWHLVRRVPLCLDPGVNEWCPLKVCIDWMILMMMTTSGDPFSPTTRILRNSLILMTCFGILIAVLWSRLVAALTCGIHSKFVHESSTPLWRRGFSLFIALTISLLGWRRSWVILNELVLLWWTNSTVHVSLRITSNRSLISLVLIGLQGY
jgi:hypothetical protein